MCTPVVKYELLDVHRFFGDDMLFGIGKKHIRNDVLPLLDKALWHQLETVWQKATAGILEAQKSTLGHQQGSSHVIAVEQNLSALIRDEWKGTKLLALDLFILSAAACLHDAGKVGDLPGDHGHVSMGEVCQRSQDFGLDTGQAEAVGWLVYAHNDKRLDALPAGPFSVRGSLQTNLRPLAALLCLADTLHCDASRVSPQVIKMLGPAAENHPVTLFRQLVRGWVFDEMGRIVIQATARHLTDIDIFHAGFESLRQEIEPINTTLATHDYPWELVASLDDSALRYQACHIAPGRGLPGMDFYHEQDAEIFKGRELRIKDLYRIVLSPSRVGLLVGDSGVGKSSLVCAGLFPFVDKLGTWQHLWSRPSTDPTKNVVYDIYAHLLRENAPPGETILAAFERLSRRFTQHKILVVLDQFEEIADVMVSDKLEDLTQSLVAVLARRFPNLYVILVYRADAQARLGPWLQRVSGSNYSLPSVYLEPLADDGACEALEALFHNQRIGLASEDLVFTIIQDIKAQGRGLYPPFIQMVAYTLVQAAQKSDSIVTAELFASLGGASHIIGYYLIHRLEEFGNQRPLAEYILKALVQSSGGKSQASLEEIQHNIQVDNDMIEPVLRNMVDKRMIRRLDADRYEAIHDYFAQLIDSELVSSKERLFKQLKELLASKAAAYAVTKTPLSNNEMLQLYLVREHLLPSQPEQILLLQSSLGGFGPAWYWFRRDSEGKYASILIDAVSHPYDEIRLNAFDFLVALPNCDVLPLARKLLEDSNSKIKSAAISAIGQLGRRGDDLSMALKMFKDQSYQIRRRAAMAISQMASQDDLSILLEMLKDSDLDIREAGIQTIARVIGEEGLPELWRMLKDKKRIIRETTARAIAQINSTKNLPRLWGMLKKRKYEIRRAAAQVIVEIANQDDLPRLLEMLNDRDFGVRKAGIEALGQLGSRDDLSELRKLLKGGNRQVRRATAQAIAQIVSRDGLPKLQELLKDDNWLVMRAAAEAIAQVAGRDDLPKLRKLLRHRAWSVREAAVKGLARLRSRDDLPRLRKLLRDHDVDVRNTTAKAITQIATRDDMPTILEMLKDRNDLTRETAIQAIAQLGNENDLSHLAEIVASSGLSDYAVAATKALTLLDRALYCPFPSRPSLNNKFIDSGLA
jgi:HEAT repeat protein